MAKRIINQTSAKTAVPRFTEPETETLFNKLSLICASIEAIWGELSQCSDAHTRGRLIDTIQVLSQVGGFIADHGQELPGYGDVYTWLEILEGGQS